MQQKDTNSGPVGQREPATHRALLIGGSVGRGWLYGELVSFPILGGIVGALVGFGHGLFRAVTRKPLDSQAQTDFVSKLESLNDAQKTELINTVKKKYQTSVINTSQASEQLFTVLNSSSRTMTSNFGAICDYVKKPYFKDSTFLLNNGKALFMLIYDEVNKLIPNVSASASKNSVECSQ